MKEKQRSINYAAILTFALYGSPILAQEQLDLPREFATPAVDQHRIFRVWQYGAITRARLFLTSMVDPSSVANFELMTAFNIPYDQLDAIRSIDPQAFSDSGIRIFTGPVMNSMVEVPSWVVACDNIALCIDQASAYLGESELYGLGREAGITIGLPSGYQYELGAFSAFQSQQILVSNSDRSGIGVTFGF